MKAPRRSFISFAFVCLVSGSVMATVDFTYENDNKTLVATVSDADTALTTSVADQAWFTEGITNFVKRGAKSLNVWKNVANAYTGDIRIEQYRLLFSGNALGIDKAQGQIQIASGALIQSGANNPVTFAKDIAFGRDGEWNQRAIEVWEDRTATITGKITTGNRNDRIVVYKNGTLNVAGGIVDHASDDAGYLYVGAYNGATVNFTGKPVVIKNPLYFNFSTYHNENPDKYRGSDGYFGHITFGVPGNSMSAIGHDTGKDGGNFRLRYYELKTTVDWAFNKSDMSVRFGNDAKWDLCGTEQRVGQFDVKVTTGNPSVVTNSSATPATLHLGMVYGPSSSPVANIRFGGNLSVVFEKNIWTTRINYPMTATGSLTITGDGTGGANSAILQFEENGSWANATNVTVNGVGKIKIANPNALGRRANVNLASASSLEIASGVTVNVRTLTVGGIQRQRGDYTFGSGTLSVTHPVGFQVNVR